MTDNFDGRRAERDKKLVELASRIASEISSPIIAESTALALKGKADMYRLQFDILMAMYQDVGW